MTISDYFQYKKVFLVTKTRGQWHYRLRTTRAMSLWQVWVYTNDNNDEIKSFQADRRLLNTVEGLAPEKEKHQFFIDILPVSGEGLPRELVELGLVNEDKYLVYPCNFNCETRCNGHGSTLKPHGWGVSKFRSSLYHQYICL